MNRNTIIALGVVAILVVGGYFFFTGSGDSAPAAPAPVTVTAPGTQVKDNRGVAFELMPPLVEGAYSIQITDTADKNVPLIYGSASKLDLIDGVVYATQPNGNRYKFTGEWESAPL